MDVHLVRAVAALVFGLPMLLYGLHILYTGQMRIRVARPWDAESVKRNSVFVGERARQRGRLFTVLGAALSGWAFYEVLTQAG